MQTYPQDPTGPRKDAGSGIRDAPAQYIWPYRGPERGGGLLMSAVQGYLAHKSTPPPRTLK